MNLKTETRAGWLQRSLSLLYSISPTSFRDSPRSFELAAEPKVRELINFRERKHVFVACCAATVTGRDEANTCADAPRERPAGGTRIGDEENGIFARVSSRGSRLKSFRRRERALVRRPNNENATPPPPTGVLQFFACTRQYERVRGPNTGSQGLHRDLCRAAFACHGRRGPVNRFYASNSRTFVIVRHVPRWMFGGSTRVPNAPCTFVFSSRRSDKVWRFDRHLGTRCSVIAFSRRGSDL